MRWGEPTRLPPVRRGRGLLAAALLAGGLVAAYAILAALSLTSVAPSILESVPTTLGTFGKPGSVPAVRPKVPDFVDTSSAPVLSELAVSLQSSTGMSDALSDGFDLRNTAKTPIDLSLEVVGAPGVQAAFSGSPYGATKHLRPDKTTHVTVTSNPLYAGVIAGSVDISVSGVAKTFHVPLSGAQAPLPPGTVVATAEAGGAVKVAWPASPSTGVSGYEVQRSVSGGRWRTLDADAPASGIVDATGTDGRTVEYRVGAVTSGLGSLLLSSWGSSGSAVTDASPPDLPTDLTIGTEFVNQTNEDAVPVEVDLPPTSAPTDVVSVTLTDDADGSVTATAAGGQPSVVVKVDASKLEDGQISAKAILTDALGNATAAFPAENSVQKDVIAPEPPDDAHGPELVNGDQASSVPVVVHLADPEAGERVHVEITGGEKTADASEAASGAATTVDVDASDLPDGQLTGVAWAVDEAGNVSQTTQPFTMRKDTSAPAGAESIRVAGGDANPVNYVNAASAGAVVAIVRFGETTDASDEISISVGGFTVHRDGGDDTYFVGPFDMSDRPDGPVPLSVRVTDSAGNANTVTDSAVKDTVAPAAPTSFTVPETSENGPGVVNSFTQSSALFQATFPEGTDSSDTLTATVEGIDLGSRMGGSIAVQWRGNVSALPDGQLDLHGTITDAAGNSTDFSGTAKKETQPPPPPVAAHVIGFCRPDTITPATAADVTVQVVLPDVPGLAGAVEVTLTDSAGHTASATAFGGPGIVIVKGIDASSFVPGHVQLSVSVTDSAGNTSTFDGTTAVYVDPDE